MCFLNQLVPKNFGLYVATFELKEDSAEFGQRETNHVKEILLTRRLGCAFLPYPFGKKIRANGSDYING